MTGCGGAMTVETCYMTVSDIAQLPGHRIVGVSWMPWDR
jgi:hypothetical protein